MLKKEDTILIIVDVQGNLARQMHDKEILFKNMQKLIKGIQALAIPILWAEQNPRGLGVTIPEIADLLINIEPISKMSFSCCGSDTFAQALKETARQQILITGIEAHVCVYQTVMDLVNLGYEVQVVADAVSSRAVENKDIALTKMRDGGIGVTSVEMALFELLKVADGEPFKKILRIVK